MESNRTSPSSSRRSSESNEKADDQKDSLYLSLLFQYNEKINSLNGKKLFQKYIRKFRIFDHQKHLRNFRSNKRFFLFRKHLFDCNRLIKDLIFKLFNFFFLFEKIHKLGDASGDKLEVLFHSRMRTIEKEFEFLLKLMRKQFLEDMKSLKKRKKDEMLHSFQDITYFYTFKKRDTSVVIDLKKKRHNLEYARSLMSVEMKSKINKLIEERRKLKIRSDEELKRIHKDYKRQKKEQDLGRKKIGIMDYRINKTREKMKMMESKWKANVREFTERNGKLKARLDVMKKELNVRRNKIIIFKKETRESYGRRFCFQKDIVKKLKKDLKVAKAILKKRELIKNMEESTGFSVKLIRNDDELDPNENITFRDIFKKRNKALIDNSCREQKLIRLKKKKKELKLSLLRHQRGVSISNEVLNNRNPLLIIKKFCYSN